MDLTEKNTSFPNPVSTPKDNRWISGHTVMGKNYIPPCQAGSGWLLATQVGKSRHVCALLVLMVRGDATINQITTSM